MDVVRMTSDAPMHMSAVIHGGLHGGFSGCLQPCLSWQITSGSDAWLGLTVLVDTQFLIMKVRGMKVRERRGGGGRGEP